MINLNSLASQLLFTTIRIVTKNNDGTQSSGTAFCVDFRVSEKRVPVLITNNHVVENSRLGTFFVHLGVQDENGQLVPKFASQPITVSNFQNRWIPHPNNDVDLCAMPFEPLLQEALAQGEEIFYKPITEDDFPTTEILSNLSALEDILMVGYPIDLWDDVNNFPVLRRGITASHPSVDFQGKSIGLADIASFPGSSGSPILVVNEGSFTSPSGICIGSRLIFLGVLYAGPQFTANGDIKIVEIPTAQTPISRTNIPTHLGYYVKAKELITLKEHILSMLPAPKELEPTA
ncbi:MULTISPECIES: trypsin-like peptidase domain-containing protein [unclassified Microcoleus]|uniref:trypsin-like peptidase domain-containing protein n=1 Tax=unclassified Microcoleus TaxID=2642155 RepID=UPI0025D50D05|nr:MULTISPECIES: trypsin-like peptidase domain-containing protein [unclassified Microcoleus]